MISEKLHFAFCINDAYAQYICVTIKSILENHAANQVVIHVLSDYISGKNKQRIAESLVGAESRASLVYHVMDNARFEGLRVKRHWPVCTWYRLDLPNVLSEDIHRVLYLDADTLVVANLEHLFQMDIEGKSLAAVKEEYSIFNEQRATNLGYDESKGYICDSLPLFYI